MYTVCRERERGLFKYDLGVVAGLTGQTKVTVVERCCKRNSGKIINYELG